MTDDDRKLVADSLSVMHGLRADMLEFRGEMKEFKVQACTRLAAIEAQRVECQKTPTVCATARSLESHLQGHAKGSGQAISVWAAAVSTVMCVFTLISTFLKRS